MPYQSQRLPSSGQSAVGMPLPTSVPTLPGGPPLAAPITGAPAVPSYLGYMAPRQVSNHARITSASRYRGQGLHSSRGRGSAQQPPSMPMTSCIILASGPGGENMVRLTCQVYPPMVLCLEYSHWYCQNHLRGEHLGRL